MGGPSRREDVGPDGALSDAEPPSDQERGAGGCDKDGGGHEGGVGGGVGSGFEQSGEHTDSDEGDSLCPNTHLDTAPLQQLTRPSTVTL